MSDSLLLQFWYKRLGVSNDYGLSLKEVRELIIKRVKNE